MAPEVRPGWVSTPPFFASCQEISTEAFCAYLNASGAEPMKNHPQLVRCGHRWVPRPGLDDLPVTWVNFHEANAFCAWLTKSRNRTFALPDETQWMAMSEGSRPGLRYPWGWHADTPGVVVDQPAPTSPSHGARMLHGLVHLAGNVYEWGRDPTQAVVRGGAWSDYAPELLQSDLVYPQPADFRSSDIGFRVVSSESPAAR